MVANGDTRALHVVNTRADCTNGEEVTNAEDANIKAIPMPEPVAGPVHGDGETK